MAEKHRLPSPIYTGAGTFVFTYMHIPAQKGIDAQRKGIDGTEDIDKMLREGIEHLSELMWEKKRFFGT